jgi:DNA-binding CsgD family transcriptional regulator
MVSPLALPYPDPDSGQLVRRGGQKYTADYRSCGSEVSVDGRRPFAWACTERQESSETEERESYLVESLLDSLTDSSDLDASTEDAGPYSETAARPLSPREHQVAGLIAQELHLAERSAANHVEHILWKLNCHSRVQIAVWVLNQAPASRNE